VTDRQPPGVDHGVEDRPASVNPLSEPVNVVWSDEHIRREARESLGPTAKSTLFGVSDQSIDQAWILLTDGRTGPFEAPFRKLLKAFTISLIPPAAWLSLLLFGNINLATLALLFGIQLGFFILIGVHFYYAAHGPSFIFRALESGWERRALQRAARRARLSDTVGPT
jgi:hypothetical protein